MRYPGEGFYSTAYNAAYGAWGLVSNNYRDQGILSYESAGTVDEGGDAVTVPASTHTLTVVLSHPLPNAS